jgi:hypothetical protein
MLLAGGKSEVCTHPALTDKDIILIKQYQLKFSIACKDIVLTK